MSDSLRLPFPCATFHHFVNTVKCYIYPKRDVSVLYLESSSSWPKRSTCGQLSFINQTTTPLLFTLIDGPLRCFQRSFSFWLARTTTAPALPENTSHTLTSRSCFLCCSNLNEQQLLVSARTLKTKGAFIVGSFKDPEILFS